jgi:hypothetical protein
MAVKSIYGGQEVKFGGAMNMDTGLGFVFLTRDSFASAGQSTVSADDAITAAAGNNANSQNGIQGLIVQQLDIQADRPLSTFYDIASANVYFVAGRSSAKAGLNRIVGPKGLILKYYAKFGNPCDAAYNFMVFDLSKSACDELGNNVTGNTSTLVVSNCVLMQIAMSVSVQNFVITEMGQVQGSQVSTQQ